MAERDYVLGTHDEEIERLGLQHRVWRPTVLRTWQDVGLTIGGNVIDVGAGPGYATIDLAGIVGPTGSVTAVERSGKFVSALKQRCAAQAITNVRVHELDLMTDELPAGDYDFSWCRWVAAFVSDPSLLMQKIGKVLRPGGLAIFHEYAAYDTWRFAPSKPCHERFRDEVVKTWRDSGGEPDIGLALPALLEKNGFIVQSAVPYVFSFRPNDFLWQWPASFIDNGVARLVELGSIDEEFAEKIHAEFSAAEKDPTTLMMTPLVLEIVAKKL